MKRLLLLTSLALFLACQGPWDYYPESSEDYRGIWIYAHVVSGRHISDFCMEKMLDLDEANVPFAFFENAHLEVSGNFNGSEQTVVLTQNPKKPNCFDGPANLLAEVGGSYELNATVNWDSSGHNVSSVFSAKTKIPKKFKVKHALTPVNNKILNRGDTTYYFAPPNDMLAHYFIPEYSADVAGALITMTFDSLTVRFGQNSLDLVIQDMTNDTAKTHLIGDRFRIDYISNQQLFNANNAIDSMPVMNMLFPIGDVKYLFYATEKEYREYVETDIYLEEDNRYKSKYNIDGAAGIFAGMLVDTFDLHVKSLPNTISFNNMETRAEKCKDENTRECRLSYPDDKRYYHGDETLYYCIANNFPLPACESRYQSAMVSKTKTPEMEDLWTWCQDRDWSSEKYPQCGTAMVSWARLTNKKSNVLTREINKWCAEHTEDLQCK